MMKLDNEGNRIDENGNIIPYTKGNIRPTPIYKEKHETLGEYRKRVDEAKELGFHLGDLSWPNWFDYCNANSYPNLREAPPEKRHYTQEGYKEEILDDDE